MAVQKIKFLIFKIAVFLFFLTLYLPTHAAGTPLIFSYQGRITDASGNLLGGSGTNYYFKFSIWDNATVLSGTKLWPTSAPTSFATSVRQGVFNVNIGDTDNSYPDVLDFNFNTNKNIYLQVEVSSDNVTFETIGPRQRISSAPFAQMAGGVSGLGQSSFGTTTPIANTIVSIESTSTSAVPLSIRSFAGQIADLFRLQDYNLNHLFSINSLGGIFGSSTLAIGTSAGNTSLMVNSSGNVGVGTADPGSKFNVFGVDSVPQLRISQSSVLFGELYVDSAGDVRISSNSGNGGNIRMQNENLWVCSGGSCDPSINPAGQGNVVVETAIILNNKFKLKQVDASTTIMYDSSDNPILEFDEGQ
ncbi:MAG: hypothetical protein WCT49_01655 [Candidatus Paceibacterota bacterium]|jgi:hypothetical protein|nr:hypothetical protein [Candidatus Paceibacterota bacterium]